MKYLIYLRVSTLEQDQETQLDYCLRFIRQRDVSDFEYEVYRDKVTSKKSLFKREGGSAMIKALNQGDIIIAMRIDRVSRKLHEVTDLISILDKKKADIFLVDQPGITNKILLGLYAGMAEEEVKTLRKRVSEKLQAKRNRGERHSRFSPYGYTIHPTEMVMVKSGKEFVLKPGILIEIEHEQKVLQEMSNLAVHGKSYQDIANELADKGYLNRNGQPFQKMSIYRILSRLQETKSQGQPLVETKSQLFR